MVVALITPTGNQIVFILYSIYIKVGASVGSTDLADFDWHIYGLIVASDYRRKVVTAIESGARTPKQIAGLTGLHLSHVSTTLSELTNAKVVECLTPELRKGKLFQLTGAGREVAKRLSTEPQSVTKP